jgi:hypothetical protein
MIDFIIELFLDFLTSHESAIFTLSVIEQIRSYYLEKDNFPVNGGLLWKDETFFQDLSEQEVFSESLSPHKSFGGNTTIDPYNTTIEEYKEYMELLSAKDHRVVIETIARELLFVSLSLILLSMMGVEPPSGKFFFWRFRRD